MFGPRHDILVLPQIPRERVALQTLIADARRWRRKSRLVRFAAYNCVAWALLILCVWMPLRQAPSRPAPIHTQAHPWRVRSSHD